MSKAGDLRIAEKRAEAVERQTRYLAECGLFAGGKDAGEGDVPSYVAILERVRRSRAFVDAKDVNASVHESALAAVELQRAIHERGMVWRLIHIHQTPISLYHFVAFAVFVQMAALEIRDLVPTLLPVKVPIQILAVGGLGAVARGVWFLWLQVSRQIFRSHFLLAHLSAPLLGSLFGLLSFLLLRAGLMTLEGTGNGDDDISTAALPYAVAFIAGYSWEWVLGRLDRLKNDAGAPAKKGSQGGEEGREKPKENDTESQQKPGRDGNGADPEAEAQADAEAEAEEEEEDLPLEREDPRTPEDHNP